MTIGLFVGRFQPFHIGHLNDIKDALLQVDKVVIAVGSSQYSNTEENPFTYEERRKMIEDTLALNEITNFSIIELPDVGDDTKWIQSIKTLVPQFDIAFTGNKIVEDLLRKNGIRVKKVTMTPNINSTKIRDSILKNDEWVTLVPKGVSTYIIRINGAERIKKIFNR